MITFAPLWYFFTTSLMLSLMSASSVIDMQMCTFAFEREKWLKNTDKDVSFWPVKITAMFHAHCFFFVILSCDSHYWDGERTTWQSSKCTFLDCRLHNIVFCVCPSRNHSQWRKLSPECFKVSGSHVGLSEMVKKMNAASKLDHMGRQIGLDVRY